MGDFFLIWSGNNFLLWIFQGKRTIEKESEEEQFRDILLLMELLTSILSKDFIDLAPPDANAPEEGALLFWNFLNFLEFFRIF